jgi:hypothetical protein
VVRKPLSAAYQAFRHKKGLLKSNGSRRANPKWREPAVVFRREGTSNEKKESVSFLFDGQG